jgi:dethiobiotin synthetase
LRLVVSGSGTGVGKTFVTAALGLALSERLITVTAIKPVESGADTVPPDLRDGFVIAAATHQVEPLEALTILSRPVAPPVAADEEGRILEWSNWLKCIESASTDVVLIEGAGGLLSPLTWSKTSHDLAIELSAPVLIVASDQLGALNSVLLSIAVATSAGVEVLGVVFSAPSTPDESTGSNAAALEKFLLATPWQLGAAGIMSLPRCAYLRDAVAHLEKLVGVLSRGEGSPPPAPAER